MRYHLLLATALGFAPLPAAAQDAAPAGIEAQSWRRFVAAAAPVSTESGEAAFLYDFVTRCAAFPVTGDLPTAWRLSAGPAQARDFAIGRMLQEGFDDLTVLRSSEVVPPSDCASRISHAYGAAFSADAASLGAIVRHGIAVLRGAEIDGADATSLPGDIAFTFEARQAVDQHIEMPILLGSRSVADRVILVLGDPTSPYRWFVQYAKLAGGSWRYEGAYDASYLRP